MLKDTGGMRLKIECSVCAFSPLLIFTSLEYLIHIWRSGNIGMCALVFPGVETKVIKLKPDSHYDECVKSSYTQPAFWMRFSFEMWLYHFLLSSSSPSLPLSFCFIPVSLFHFLFYSKILLNVLNAKFPSLVYCVIVLFRFSRIQFGWMMVIASYAFEYVSLPPSLCDMLHDFRGLSTT